jgi:septal ring factor EnvC (AmiA/AmiB activator)
MALASRSPSLMRAFSAHPLVGALAASLLLSSPLAPSARAESGPMNTPLVHTPPAAAAPCHTAAQDGEIASLKKKIQRLKVRMEKDPANRSTLEGRLGALEDQLQQLEKGC